MQLLARFERLDERITSNTPELADPNVGRTTVTSLQVGVTYWYTKRYRAMVNYVFNNFEGDSRAVSATTWGNLGGGHNEHEVLFRGSREGVRTRLNDADRCKSARGIHPKTLHLSLEVNRMFHDLTPWVNL